MVVAAGMFAMIGGCSSDTSDSSSKPAPNAKTADGNAEDEAGDDVGSDPATAIPVGTQIKFSEGWEFKVNSAELAKDEALSQDDSATGFPPDDDEHTVVVNVTMINDSGEADSPIMNMQTRLLPPSGENIEAQITRFDDACDVFADLRPDTEYTCSFAFNVKTDEADDSLLSVAPLTNIEAGKRFFALK